MASTNQTKTTQTANQTKNTASANDGVQSIADALAALPKETEQTMKEFLDQQLANAKNVNDDLVEQFGSAIDNSEFAASMNEVKEAFRKDADQRAKSEENAKQQEYLTSIQNDLERILENQGEALRADVTRDDAVNDTSLNEVEHKDDEKVDEETDVVKEDIKPTEVKVDVQLPEMSKDDSYEEGETKEPSKSETLLGNIESGQEEQNSLLNDIRDKLSDVDSNYAETDESETNEPSKSETLLENIESAQNEQNALLDDIGQKLTDVDSNDTDESKSNVPSNEENLLKDIVTAQDEQNTLLNDIGQKLTEVDDVNVEQPEEATKDVHNDTELNVAEVNDSLGKINDSLDDILDQFGESVANTDVNEPVPVNVHVDVNTQQPETEKDIDEKEDKTQSVELAESSLDSLRELADTVKENEADLLEKMNNNAVTSNEENEPTQKNSITELANDISGASDAMNNQDDTPLKSREDEKVSATENEHIDRDADKSLQYDEDVNQFADMEERAPVLDTRMDMAARAERDVTPVLNDVQMFSRMSLTTEEIHVLASEIGKAVAENMIDREGDKERDAAYIDEVERIVRG